VSPYYPESGGTFIDWVDEDWGNQEDAEESTLDGSGDGGGFEDIDFSEFDNDADDELPL
jgi:hypothetical protein